MKNKKIKKINTTISPIFENDLYKDMQPHPDVKRLQQLLNLDPETQVAREGDGSPGKEIETYGPLTEGAVRKFQTQHSVVSFGPKTRKAMVEAYEYKPGTNESKSNADETKRASDEIPSEALAALTWAISRKGKVLQPCETQGCLYNYDPPQQKGESACKTPTPKADPDDEKRGNHKDLHPNWFLYCARFAQHAFGVVGAGDAIVMYRALAQEGVISQSNDIPRGALVFWDYTQWGHVGLCLGNGKIIHTGVNSNLIAEGIKEDLISEITNKLFYLGWAYPTKDWLVLNAKR